MFREATPRRSNILMACLNHGFFRRWLELIVGARDKRDLAVIDGFLSRYSAVPLTGGMGTRAYLLLKTYAKSHGLHVFDSLIAATALENALTLVTRNRKHYEMIDGLKIQVPDY